jgi:hypothetical protein
LLELLVGSAVAVTAGLWAGLVIKEVLWALSVGGPSLRRFVGVEGGLESTLFERELRGL